MFRADFKELLRQNLKDALDAPNLKSSLQKMAEAVSKFYPGTKIWFTRRFGKRWSYIAGAGEETYNPPEKIIYLDDYAVFLQNFKDIYFEEKAALSDLFKLITIIQDIQDEVSAADSRVTPSPVLCHEI
jgi:hypothetical protein